MSAVRVIKSGGMLFDGRSGYVRIPASPLLYPEDFTVMAWVNIVATSLSYRRAFDAGSIYAKNWWFPTGPYGEPRIIAVIQGTGGVAEVSFPVVRTGEWHHYAGVKDGNVWKTYFDGMFYRSVTIPGSYVRDPSIHITIACRPDLLLFSNIIVTDFRIYNRPLRDAEISLIYQRGEAIREGLVLWYTFHEGQGDIVHDVSGNNLHGRRFGGAYWMVKPSTRQLASTRVLSSVR